MTLKTHLGSKRPKELFERFRHSLKKSNLHGDNWVKIGGLKLVCDGSISERTARLSEPYIGRPNYYGIIINNEDEIFEQALKAHLNDWQIGVHANGDVGIDITLKVFERLQKEKKRIDPIVLLLKMRRRKSGEMMISMDTFIFESRSIVL